jgi:hypothetical protein
LERELKAKLRLELEIELEIERLKGTLWDFVYLLIDPFNKFAVWSTHFVFPSRGFRPISISSISISNPNYISVWATSLEDMNEVAFLFKKLQHLFLFMVGYSIFQDIFTYWELPKKSISIL